MMRLYRDDLGASLALVALALAIALYLWQERDKDLFRVWRDEVRQMPPLVLVMFAAAMMVVYAIFNRSTG
jgi:hypothetical protein